MKKLLFTIMMVFSVITLSPALVGADDSSLFQFCSQHPDSSVCKSRTKDNPVLHVIQVATDVIALIAGIAAVILIIVGGLRIITSSGNQEAVASGRKRITSALIGLVIIALSWLIISFVIDKLIQT